jgi:hypothetical protein
MGGSFVLFWIGVVALAIVLSWQIQVWTKKQLRQIPPTCTPVRLFGTVLPTATWVKFKLTTIASWRVRADAPVLDEQQEIQPDRQDRRPAWREAVRRVSWPELAEILVVILWACWVGKAFFNFNPLDWPFGSEFSSSVQSGYIWSLLPKCGACVFWNSFLRGGFPSFVDTHGFMLYPPAVITTLLWGVLNGSKAVLIISLATAGLAQWWLSKVMGLGRVARLWCALMAVVGGHLAGRMELGAVGVVTSTAACSLALAPMLGLGLTGKRRYAILLGLAWGLALLAGQGYMQVGFALGVFPALLFFLFDRGGRVKPVWKDFLLAMGLAFLVAGVFLVPLLHIYPYITKDTDPAFTPAQSIAYVPLNLVINDIDFFRGTALKPEPSPYLYVNYIGWIPVLLAMTTLAFFSKLNKRLLFFFLTAILLVFLTASADVLRIWSLLFPEFMAGVRHPGQIAGLAIPLVLGLSGWGLDELLKLKWPRLVLVSPAQEERRPFLQISTALLLAVPLFFALKSAHDMGQVWLTTIRFNYDAPLVDTIRTVATSSSEWVNPPFGEHFWSVPALDAGLKVGVGITHWLFKDREAPGLYYEAVRGDVDPAQQSMIVKKTADISILYHPENEYASVQVGSQKIPCKASSLGGNIDVVCNTDRAGTLVVQENNWAGWYAARDRKQVAMYAGNWLSVAAPAGVHTYQFRYRPWDVWVGLALTVMGFVLCGVLWRRNAALVD